MGKGQTKDGELAAILREILMIQACHNIQLVVEHVMGESNPVADALSRVHMAKSTVCKRMLLSTGCKESRVDNQAFILNLEL